MSVCGGAFPPCAVSAPPGLLPGTSRAYPWLGTSRVSRAARSIPPGRSKRFHLAKSILYGRGGADLSAFVPGEGRRWSDLSAGLPGGGDGGQTIRLAFPAGATVGRLFGWSSRRGRRWADYSVGLPGGGKGFFLFPLVFIFRRPLHTRFTPWCTDVRDIPATRKPASRV